MSAFALDYTYRYPFPSELNSSSSALRLAITETSDQEHPYFFEGHLVQPKRTADLLRGMMQIVQARFHLPPALLGRQVALYDPVVTSSEDRLRFEGFSGCGGVYVRVDLLPPAVRGETVGRGTTNVDFNPSMLSALARIRASDEVALSVGADRVELESNRDSILEKKVQLPLRWLKGFLEVQAVQQRMQPVHDISAVEALRFLRSLPRMNTGRRESWIVTAGRGLRISQCETRGAVRVGGLQRLRVLEALAPISNRLRIFTDEPTGASAWVLDLEDSRFHLVISPEVWRGFSGEGQMLESLGKKRRDENLPRVHAALRWDTQIDIAEVATRIGTSAEQIRTCLATLGSRGLVGFDLIESAYFHRELPFDLSRAEQLQSRLMQARKLLDNNQVHVSTRIPDRVEVIVVGSGVKHRVRWTGNDDNEIRCTCPWFARHGTSRGPCKHILASKMVLEEPTDDGPGN
jgi:hypothetical protein